MFTKLFFEKTAKYTFQNAEKMLLYRGVLPSAKSLRKLFFIINEKRLVNHLKKAVK